MAEKWPMLANQVTFVIAKPWSKQLDLRAPAEQSHRRHCGTDPAAAERQSRLVAGDDRFARRESTFGITPSKPRARGGLEDSMARASQTSACQWLISIRRG